MSRIGIPIPPHLDPPVTVRRHNLRHAINTEKIHQVSDETGNPIIYCIAKILKQEDGISIDIALGARYSGSGPIVGDAILPVIHGAPMMLTRNESIPSGMFSIITFIDS